MKLSHLKAKKNGFLLTKTENKFGGNVTNTKYIYLLY